MHINYNRAREFRHVLQKVEAFFEVHLEDKAFNLLESGTGVNDVNEFGTPLTPLIEQNATPWFVSGMIEAAKRVSFERVLWRACRRTAFVRTADIDEMFEDSITGKPVEKCAFIIFFKGEKLQDIVNRVCEGFAIIKIFEKKTKHENTHFSFNAAQYRCPKTSRDRQLAIADITIRLNDLKTVLEQTEDQKISMLRNIAYDLPEWQREIHLQKSIYHTLNKFTYDSSGNFVIAECWVPDVHFESVKEALQKGSANSGTTIRPIINVLSTNETPPTYNRVNKFTAVFQSIVDSYGIACYREMNPAPYIIITFPFLFAVMFGDVGHGLKDSRRSKI
uniref:V-type proton ATPase subunit a n=1 Tax=Panagrolaimus davidi TaxID=227884 RepID=A0A914PSC6_9BILA